MLTASKILARPKDSGQRMLLRTSGCRKNVFSSQSPRKTVPGEAISAKLGVLANSTALPGLVTKVIQVTGTTPGTAPTVTFSVTTKAGVPVDISKITSRSEE